MARTSMYLDGHTYSLFDPDEVHRDLRADPTRARTVMARSKGVAAAHEFCDPCRDIARELSVKETVAAGYESLDAAILAHSGHDAQYVISRANLARMLQLGPGETVARMFVTDDPYLLHVIVSGAHFRPVPDGTATPVVRASRINPPPAA